MFIHDFRGFTKAVQVVRRNKTVVTMANNFNLAVENHTDKHLEVVSEELSNEQWLEL